MPFIKEKNFDSWIESMRIWLMPFIVVISLSLFVIISAKLYLRNESLYRSAKSEQIAEAIGKTISGGIWQRVTILKVLAEEPRFFENQRYGHLAKSLTHEFSDFYAVNLIDKNGKIIKVFPFDNNAVALGHNLLENESVKDYLIEARQTKSARMSHLIDTYQKIPAFTLYVPLYDDNKNFNGWLNGVVDFETWVRSYIESNGLQDTHIRISWDRPNSRILERGPATTEESFRYVYQILNQKIIVEVGFVKSSLDDDRARYYMLMLGVGLLLLVLISVFMVELTLSRENARVVNSYLALKSSLLSSLTHDISSPLMALAINFERAKAGGELTPQQKERIEYSLKTMEEMLKNARFLHAQELGMMQIKLEAVPLAKAIQDSLALVTEQAQQKRIKIEVDQIPSSITVQAEHATLANNILLNAFTNAIKFSPLDSVVKLKVEISEKEVSLAFEDLGRGFSERQIKSYRKISNLNVAEGSAGERGTGLGLLQIRSLLNFYGGKLRLENNSPTGARVIIFFKRFPDSKNEHLPS